MVILIAGAGLAGLSAALHLGGREYRIIEREDRPGGLCRTIQKGDHTFDYGGHLLHIRGDDVRGLVMELLGDRLRLHRRRSSIFSKGVMTPYPFQVNTHGLPWHVVRDCLTGFVRARIEQREKSEPEDFRGWLLYTFGQGFAEHFFFPFNEKFFKVDLGEITREWASWSIPRPDINQVVEGALGIPHTDMGYNPEFYYPESRGIEELPRALHREIARPVETGVELVRVIPRERRALLSTGEELTYEKLISTLPLDRLVSMLEGAPDKVKRAGEGLRALSVLCVNIGISGPAFSDRHWVYVPEPEYSFHRIGVYSNLSSPGPGKSSLYLEITMPGPMHGLEGSELDQAVQVAVRGLQNMPLWKQEDHEIEAIEPALIRHGYVIYDRHRKKELPRITDFLQEHGIEPCGRYGRWEYSTMEDAIRQGKEIANRCAP